VYSRSATLVPVTMRGATYRGGLVHVTDWHAAFAHIGAGGALGSAGSDSDSDFPIDGMAGVFDAIAGNATSPRKEFLVNILDDATAGGPVGAAYVEWPWKLYLQVDNTTWTPVPTTAGDDDETSEARIEMVGEMATVDPTETDFRYITPIGSSLDMNHPVDRDIATTMLTRMAKQGASSIPADDDEASDLLNLLFNLETDPTEHKNVYAANPTVVARITSKIEALRKVAIPVCQNGGIGAGAGKGCSYTDPQASIVANASGGAWLPWIK